MATTLQWSFFLDASFVERMFHQCCLVFNLWNGWKNFLPTNRKVRKKNKIPKYHASSPKKTIKKIRDQLMKNLLTQWDTEKENQKILSVFDKKPPNPGGKWRRKPEKIKQKRSLRLFYLLGSGSGGRLSKLTTFLHWSRRGPCHWWSHIDKEKDCC